MQFITDVIIMMMIILITIMIVPLLKHLTVFQLSQAFTLLSMRSQTILLLKYSMGVHLMPSCTYSSCKEGPESERETSKEAVNNKKKVKKRKSVCEPLPALPLASAQWRSAGASHSQSWCRTVRNHFSDEQKTMLTKSQESFILRRVQISPELSGHWEIYTDWMVLKGRAILQIPVG